MPEDSRWPEPEIRSTANVCLPRERRADEMPRALVVLGCRIGWTGGGELAGAAGRRVRKAVEAFEREECTLVVASGGRVWNGVVEADAMRDELVRLGVPSARVACERCSHTTGGNARFTSELLSRKGIGRALLVTCDWHAPRASALFRTYGLRIEVVAAVGPRAGPLTRAWRWGRERAATRLFDTKATRRASP